MSIIWIEEVSDWLGDLLYLLSILEVNPDYTKSQIKVESTVIQGGN